MTEPGDLQQNVALHLKQWLLAYGADFPVPPGNAPPEKIAAVAPRTTVAAPTGSPALQDPQKPTAENANAAASEATPLQATPLQADQPLRPAEQATPATEGMPEVSADKTISQLRALRAEIQDCDRCKLHQGRQTTVFGEGNAKARVMFIGEAPGAREDQTGRPFVGPAGQLLDRILQGAMGLRREDVFIANINKCRPPGNRAPEAEEVAACLPYLQQQVALIQPEVLVCLGRTAAQNLLGSTESTTALRRQQHEYCGIPVIVTWHPAYLLRDPSHKRETWNDIKQVNKLLGLPELPSGKD